MRFEAVCKRHRGGETLALEQLEFEVAEGEMVFVAGHSGAGKSTLLKLIALVERPSSGRVEVLGQDLAGIRRRGVSAHRRTLGLVFQDHRLLTDRTVFDNVALPLVVGGWPHAEIIKRVRGALDRVALGHKERALPLALSGGEQQRVGIARALAARPALLLADEPTGNLDSKNGEAVMELLDELHSAGATILMVTHDPRYADFADRKVYMFDGRIVDEQTLHRLRGEEDARLRQMAGRAAGSAPGASASA